MTIVLDTNVILDILQKREPFFSDSYQVLRKAIATDTECLVSATAATDIFYILRKALQSTAEAKAHLERLAHLLTFADVQGADITAALMRAMPDFEDAVVDAVAERNGVQYIVTRNTKDFSGSVIPAITPADYIKG